MAISYQPASIPSDLSGLNDSLLRQITEGLVEEFSPEQIFLFGSHAWGNPGPDSDLDVLVIVSESDMTPAKRAARAYRRLRNIPYPLDIMVKTRQEINRFSKVPAALEHQVLQNGKRIYG